MTTLITNDVNISNKKLKIANSWFTIYIIGQSEEYMRGKLFRIIIAFSVIFSFVFISCAGTRNISPTSYADSAVYSLVRGDAPVYSYSVLKENLRSKEGVLTVPWQENAVETAKRTNTIRFYFMSGEKQSFSDTSGIKMGDSCLAVFPDGTTMLIDAGMSDYASTLVKNLKMLGVEELDYVVLSHFHNDHYGSMWSSNGVLYSMKVGKFLWSGIYNESQGAKNSFEAAIRANDVETVIVSKGDSFDIGDAHIDIYAPTPDNIGQHLGETALNNSSIAMKITFGDFKALFCGDLYVDGEYKVLAMNDEGVFDADLVKANHHGRDTSNSKDWVAATTPRVVVATCGNPIDTTTYGWYSRVGAKVFNDYLDGYVRVVSDGYNCEVTTARPRTTTLFDNFDKIAEQIYPSN